MARLSSTEFAGRGAGRGGSSSEVAMGRTLAGSSPAAARTSRTNSYQDAAPAFVRLVMRLMSAGVRRKARHAGVDYSFLFMRADGEQLRKITALIDGGAIRPVIDRVFPFDATNEALAYVDSGRTRGKVVVKVR